MKEFVIGVDGGGSKTEAVILNNRGQEMGRGRGGPSNFHIVGKKGVREALVAATSAAASAAGISIDEAKAVVWALAGAGRAEEIGVLRQLQAQLLPGVPGRVVNDAQAALAGGVGARFGLVVISGTGLMVYGEDGVGNASRAGGWGHILDGGSGYAIAIDALRAITKAVDGSDLSTHLTYRILDVLQLDTPQDLIPWLYAPERQPSDIAALAPQVLAEAEKGDLLAVDAALQATNAIAAGVVAVARRLGLDKVSSFPLILTGGLLTGNAFFRSLAAQSIRTRMPAARPQRPRFDAAVGAGLLALEFLGQPLAHIRVDEDEEENVWASEKRNLLTNHLDVSTSLKLVGLMHLEDRRAVSAVRAILPDIANAIDAITVRMRQGGRLVYVGAGTSGRLGVLDASECPPTFNTAPGQVVGVIAGGERALTQAVEEAEDNPVEGAQAMSDLEIGPQDSVVGIAASGRTPYVIGALAEAQRRGALTIALTCNLPAPLTKRAEHILAPLVGPEVITGSTRLKAGTAQKLILNMLSTGVMVRLGKTYGNLMVDVQQLNAKLLVRARRIVAQACGINEDAAAAELQRCNGDVKTAIVMVRLGCSPEEARLRLLQAGGNVRTAITSAAPAHPD